MADNLSLNLRLAIQTAEGETALRRFQNAFDTVMRDMGRSTTDISGLRQTFREIDAGRQQIGNLDAATQHLYRTFQQGRDNAGFLNSLGIRQSNAQITASIAELRTRFESLRASGVLTNNELQQAAARTRAAMQQLASGFNTTSSSASGLASGLNKAQLALSLIAGLIAGNKITEYSDEMQLLRARLALVEGGADGAGVAIKALSAIAIRSQTDIEAVGSSYVKFNTAIKALGGSSQQALQFTEAVALSLKVSGASSQEAGAAMRQLAQAMQKGKLNGDEFVSISENGGKVLDYLAKALGVTRGKLLEMSQAGTLTSEKLLQLTSSLKQIQADAATLPSTVGGAFTNLTTKLKLFIDSSVLVKSVVSGLVTVLEFVGNHLDQIGGILATLGIAAIAASFGRLVLVFQSLLPMLTLGITALNPWVIGIAAIGTAASIAYPYLAEFFKSFNATPVDLALEKFKNAETAIHSIATGAQDASVSIGESFKDAAKKSELLATSAGASEKALTDNLKAQLADRLAAIDAQAAAQKLALSSVNESEASQAQQGVDIIRQASDDKLAAVDAWALNSLQVVDKYYKDAIALEQASGRDTTEINRQSVAAQIEILTQRATAYQQNINVLMAEEDRLLNKARAAAEERANFSAGIEDRIRSLKQKGLTDYEAYQDRETQIAEKTSLARKALAEGDSENAKKLAEQAISLAESNARAVTETVFANGQRIQKEVISESTAVSKSIEQVGAAAKIVDQALLSQEQSYKNAGQAAKDSLGETQAQYQSIADQIQKLRDSQAIDIKIKLNTQEADIEALVPKLQTMLDAKNLSLKIAADAADLEISLAEAIKTANGNAPQLTPQIELQSDNLNAELDKLQTLANEAGITLTPALNDSDARAKLENLRADLASPTSINVNAETTAAQSAINQLKQPTSSVHTVYVQKVQQNAIGGLIEKYATGGFLPRQGKLSGYGGGDKIRSLLEAGEFIVRKEAVKKLGLSVMQSINAGELPAQAAMATGGLVGGSSSENDSKLKQLLADYQDAFKAKQDILGNLQKSEASGAYLGIGSPELIKRDQLMAQADTVQSKINTIVEEVAKLGHNLNYVESLKSAGTLSAKIIGQTFFDGQATNAQSLASRFAAIPMPSINVPTPIASPIQQSIDAAKTTTQTATPAQATTQTTNQVTIKLLGPDGSNAKGNYAQSDVDKLIQTLQSVGLRTA